MYWLQLKNFLRSGIAVVGLAVVFLAGISSVYIGKQHIEKQKANAEQTANYQREHIERNVRFFNKDMGLLLYYLRFSLLNQTHPLNALSIGQRDVNSSIQFITIRNLENQKYDTDLFNPSSLLAGNLDFSFVLIYLFPLLIIAFTYNLLSEEKENGTWKLVAAQSRKPRNVLLQKLLIRAATVLLLLLALIGLAIPIVGLPVDNTLLATTSISILYILFWFALSGWIISLQKSSGTNAVMLVSAWMMLTVIFPGVANNYLTNKYPVPEAMATVVAQREGYHEKWDKDKKATIDKFYSHYPQYKKYGVPDAAFSWLWYYAMQQMGDDDAKQHAVQLQKKLWQRERASAAIAYFVPALHTQHQLNTLGQSGLANYLHFLDSTTVFHEQLRVQFYPKIFENQAAGTVNWQAFDLAWFNEPVKVNWNKTVLPLLLLTGVFMLLGGFKLVAIR